MREGKWYRRQLYGLSIIIKDGENPKPVSNDRQIAKEYVLEKLYLILSGQGINFHPRILNYLETAYLDKYWKYEGHLEEDYYETIRGQEYYTTHIKTLIEDLGVKNGGWGVPVEEMFLICRSAFEDG